MKTVTCQYTTNRNNFETIQQQQQQQQHHHRTISSLKKRLKHTERILQILKHAVGMNNKCEKVYSFMVNMTYKRCKITFELATLLNESGNNDIEKTAWYVEQSHEKLKFNRRRPRGLP